MRSKSNIVSLMFLLMVAVVCLILPTGCSIFRATGEGVEAVGQGAGTAIKGTGRAIVNGADDAENDIRRSVN